MQRKDAGKILFECLKGILESENVGLEGVDDFSVIDVSGVDKIFSISEDDNEITLNRKYFFDAKSWKDLVKMCEEKSPEKQYTYLSQVKVLKRAAKSLLGANYKMVLKDTPIPLIQICMDILNSKQGVRVEFESGWGYKVCTQQDDWLFTALDNSVSVRGDEYVRGTLVSCPDADKLYELVKKIYLSNHCKDQDNCDEKVCNHRSKCDVYADAQNYLQNIKQVPDNQKGV